MISASLVKELREKTGAGMLDCKKALEANDGNIDASIDWLREKGISKAAKKADRIAAEGARKGTREVRENLGNGGKEIRAEGKKVQVEPRARTPLRKRDFRPYKQMLRTALRIFGAERQAD